MLAPGAPVRRANSNSGCSRSRPTPRICWPREKLTRQDKVRLMQTNWIGKSQGARFRFGLTAGLRSQGASEDGVPPKCSPRRPDTLGGESSRWRPDHPITKASPKPRGRLITAKAASSAPRSGHRESRSPGRSRPAREAPVRRELGIAGVGGELCFATARARFSLAGGDQRPDCQQYKLPTAGGALPGADPLRTRSPLKPMPKTAGSIIRASSTASTRTIARDRGTGEARQGRRSQ